VRVLVVEDSRALADVVVEGLRDEGMAVDVAYDGLQAATKLDLNSYNVVVLDRDLPGLHGDTLCGMIAERASPAMVLMLTASGSPAERVSGLSLGADDYLSKPFHFPELVLRVRALARRQPTARARILRAAGIELDPLQHTAIRDGRRLDLSAKEYGVQEALMRANAVLSALDLLKQIWDEHADPFTNTVHVTISRLRRKLGDPKPSKRSPTSDTTSRPLRAKSKTRRRTTMLPPLTTTADSATGWTTDMATVEMARWTVAAAAPARSLRSPGTRQDLIWIDSRISGTLWAYWRPRNSSVRCEGLL
jgi:DNA-binding response OmpR family regulator